MNKRDNRPELSISFYSQSSLAVYHYVPRLIRHAGGDAAIPYPADFVWLLVLNDFFFFDVNPRYHYSDIDVQDLHVCNNGGWYTTTRSAPNTNSLKTYT
ncbi:hypothetical protein GIX45_19790 [Erwinia sp. CPCC 100877]|nr:hypothetical protein [Erwinia sp. CPCC 100877]